MGDHNTFFEEDLDEAYQRGWREATDAAVKYILNVYVNVGPGVSADIVLPPLMNSLKAGKHGSGR